MRTGDPAADGLPVAENLGAVICSACFPDPVRSVSETDLPTSQPAPAPVSERIL
jgi:hypothetical protein